MTVFTLALFAFVASLYLLYFGFVAKPEWTLYAFLFLWLFTPKIVLRQPVFHALGLPEVEAYYVFVAPVAALAILIALGVRTNGKLWKRAPIGLRRFTLLFLATGTFSFLFSLMFGAMKDIPEVQKVGWEEATELVFGWQDWIFPVTFILYGVVFLYGCMAFLTRRRQVETVFLLFVLAGIELVVEVIVFFYLGLFPWLRRGAIHPAGRFQSLTQNAFEPVAIITIIAVCCALYFVLSRRSYPLLPFLSLFLLPPLATFERAPLAALLLAVGFFGWVGSQGLLRGSVASAAILALCALIFLGLDQSALGTAASLLGAGLRQDYFGLSSAFSRLALWGRALDVFLFWFPFGVGPGLAPYVLKSAAPEYFRQYSGFSSPLFLLHYGNVAEGRYVTSVHNQYLEFIVEHGLLGVVTLTVFCGLILRNYRSWLRGMRNSRWGDRARYLPHVCVYAVLLSLGVFYLFVSYAQSELYFIFFMFLYFTFLLNQPAAPASSGVPRGKASELSTVAGESRV